MSPQGRPDTRTVVKRNGWRWHACNKTNKNLAKLINFFFTIFTPHTQVTSSSMYFSWKLTKKLKQAKSRPSWSSSIFFFLFLFSLPTDKTFFWVLTSLTTLLNNFYQASTASSKQEKISKLKIIFQYFIQNRLSFLIQ